MRLPALAIIATLVVLCGCKAHPKLPKTRPLPASAPAPMIEQSVRPFSPPSAQPMPVKEGPAPLVYLLETAGRVRVMEVESGAVIAESPAMPRSIVSIDQRVGVKIGNQLLVKGPLASDRTYRIYLETGGANEFRQQTITPLKPNGR